MKFRTYLNVDQNEINRSFDDDADQLIFTVRQQALIYFNKQEEYHRIIEEREDKWHIREKYNGRYFSDLDNDKSMIDVHMKTFEKHFAQTDEEFRRWIIKTDVEQIKQEIDKYKQEFQQNHSWIQNDEIHFFSIYKRTFDFSNKEKGFSNRAKFFL